MSVYGNKNVMMIYSLTMMIYSGKIVTLINKKQHLVGNIKLS
jgi:hypothetical protein